MANTNHGETDSIRISRNLSVHPNIFYERGLQIAGIRTRTLCDTNMEYFRSHFGVSPGVASIIWDMIFCRLPNNFCFYHVLWGLLFMKVYATAPVLAGKVGADEGTFRERSWKVVKAIASLKCSVIKLSNRFRRSNGSICNLTVDGTDFRIPEPTPFRSGWYSHKFNGPGLRYEVGICIQTGWICWIFGPFACGKWSDLKIFRARLKTMLVPRERVEADGGYRGDIRISDPDDSANLRETLMKNAARSRHETVNRRFKQFECLKSFRHDKNLHVHLFEAIATITQIGIENGEPPYGVIYKRPHLF